MNEMDTSQYVVADAKLPLHRKLGAELFYPMMRLQVPGAAWMYFRCVLGGGLSIKVRSIEGP